MYTLRQQIWSQSERFYSRSPRGEMWKRKSEKTQYLWI